MRLHSLIVFVLVFSVALHALPANAAVDELPERITIENQVLKSPLVKEQSLLNRLDASKLTISESIYLSTLVARINFFKGNIDVAKRYFDFAEELVGQESDSWSTGYFYLYRAFFSIEIGKLDEAKHLIKKSKNIFTQVRDSEQLARVQAIEGIILIWREEYIDALRVLEDAYAYINRNQVSETTKLVVLDAMTAYYSSLKYYEKGIELAYQADAIAKLANNILEGLPAKYNLCLILLRKQMLNEAKECYQEMRDIAEQFDLPRYQFWAPSGLGKVALAEGDFAGALSYFDKAQRLENVAIVNPAHLIVLRNNQAKALSALAKYEQAITKLSETFTLLEHYESPLNNRYLRQTLRLKAEIFEDAGNHKAAVETFREYVRLLEENENQTKLILEQEVKSFYEAEHHKLRLALSDQKLIAETAKVKELQNEKSLTLAYVLVFVATLLVALTFWYFQRQFHTAKRRFFTKDPLTGLYNRLFLHERLQHYTLERINFCLVTLDLVDFKKFNDQFGYLVGDEVLRQFAKVLTENFRESQDIIIRSGGEEFVILCRLVSVDDIVSRLNKVKSQLNNRTKQMVDDEVEVETQIIKYDQQGLTTLLVQIDNAFRHNAEAIKSRN